MFQGQFDLETATPVETAIPDLLFERGLYWASGRSGVVNLVAAHKWFNLAALKGRTDLPDFPKADLGVTVANADCGSYRAGSRPCEISDLQWN